MNTREEPADLSQTNLEQTNSSQTDLGKMEQCAGYLKALGDPVRLQVIRALRTGPLSVTDLALLLDEDGAKVSHHLRVLYHADLVTTTRDGKFIYYQLNTEFLKQRTARKLLDFGCCKIELQP
ncbi:MAG: winged helix-turn-helix transcriptional regulator [Pirellulaceae bacterium]|nr:winged helix-turn-helix transcriptional regulator [Pirellulaceae bacterium]